MFIGYLAAFPAKEETARTRRAVNRSALRKMK